MNTKKARRTFGKINKNTYFCTLATTKTTYKLKHMRRLILLFFICIITECSRPHPTAKGHTAIIIIATLGCICTYLSLRMKKKNNMLKQKQTEADGYHNELLKSKYRINRLEKEKQAKKDEIHLLKKEIKENEIRHKKTEEEKVLQMTEILEHGKKLADCIEKNMPTVAWSKKDLADFARYYNMVNPKFAEATAAEFSSLTDKQILFLILKDIGKADADIQQIMVLTDRGMNSCKTRLEKRRHGCHDAQNHTATLSKPHCNTAVSIKLPPWQGGCPTKVGKIFGLGRENFPPRPKPYY